MAGIDRITERIIEEAKLKADEILQAANVQAEEIRNASQETCRNMEKVSEEKMAQLRQIHEERKGSMKEQIQRKTLLQAKQEIIQSVIDDACSALRTQDTETYFDWMERLIRKYAWAESGEIYFSSKDMERMPENFEKRITQAAQSKGGTLKLKMDENHEEMDGFILKYGGIEENCTIPAMASAMKDDLWDRVNAMLFA